MDIGRDALTPPPPRQTVYIACTPRRLRIITATPYGPSPETRARRIREAFFSRLGGVTVRSVSGFARIYTNGGGGCAANGSLAAHSSGPPINPLAARYPPQPPSLHVTTRNAYIQSSNSAHIQMRTITDEQCWQ